MICLNRTSLTSVAILIQLCLALPAFTQAPMGAHTKRFENNVYFWEYLPPGYNPAEAEQYPLMIFLHGSGQRADTALTHQQRITQLGRVLSEGVPYEINHGCNMCFTVDAQPQECFIVLSPQRDKHGYAWPAITEDLLDWAMATYGNKINPSKMYITGLSMGGIGTIDYIESNRHFAANFAAAAVAPGGEENWNNACIMRDRDIDFWAVHGKNDGTGGTRYSTEMLPFMNAVRECEPNTNFFVINSTGHFVWDDFYHTGVVTTYTPAVRYSPNVYEWFLRNPKGNSNYNSNQKPIVFAGKNVSTATTIVNIVGKAVDYDGVLTATTLEWSKLSGPSATFTQSAATVFKDSLNRTANITLTADGTYIFVLASVDNKGRPNADTVVITKGPHTAPTVSVTSPTSGQSFSAPATITITANAADADGSITKVEFFAGATKLGEGTTTPYSYTWVNAGPGTYTITAKATDNAGTAITSAGVNITVVGGPGCTASGQITRDFWADVTGTDVTDIPLNTPPTSSSQLSLFEGPTNVGNNYGARIRGYICVPTSGNYTFWIASDDKSELWLSNSDDPADKVKIAAVNAHTSSREWTKYPVQQSALIPLIEGQRYYIEALHKEATGAGDNIAVGWQLPDGTLERPIPGMRLSPYIESTPPTECTASGEITREFWADVTGTDVTGIPLNTPPTSTSQLALFEGPINVGNNYGARIRGYICVPASGNYTFWIASDDKSELWLSNSDDPAGKVKIAAVNAHTSSREWTKYPVQQSALIPLVAGQRYYIEALHKEATGAGDNVAVGWQLPDGTLERPIPGTRLSPFTTGSGARTAFDTPTPDPAPTRTGAARVAEQASSLYPNPVKNVLHLDGIEQEADIKIYDTMGMLLLNNTEARSNSQVKLDVAHMQPGVYYVILQCRQRMQHYKFIKE